MPNLSIESNREKVYRRHHYFAARMESEYNKAAKDYGHPIAVKVLQKMLDTLKLGKTGLFCDSSDDQIIQYARTKSKALELQFFEHARRTENRESAVAWLEFELEKTGLYLPLDIKDSDSPEEIKQKKIAACARVFCEKWWRRKLRKMAVRGVENVARQMGMVNKRAGVYVSDYTFKRRQFQQNRNRQLLLNLVAENEDGYSKTLAEMSDKSVSNPVNRHNELMTRIRGYEEVAEAAGFKGVFLTLTCPSAYHARHVSGHKNNKFNGATPAEAQRYLCEQWAKIRASWDRAGARCFGFRVAEPHHDGTPHWHLMLFFAPDKIDQAVAIFERYALEIDGDEKGADKHRCEVVHMDGRSPAGYIAKYIAKNIPGVAADKMADQMSDEAAELVAVTACRVDAWASCWGIRQFQQIGSVSVTVWRELRRIKAEHLEGLGLEELEAIRAACDAGNWREFVELMGGPLVERGNQPVRAYQVATGKENSYGEMAERIKGVIMRGARRWVQTRLHQWTISQPEIAGKSTAGIRAEGFALGP